MTDFYKLLRINPNDGSIVAYKPNSDPEFPWQTVCGSEFDAWPDHAVADWAELVPAPSADRHTTPADERDLWEQQANVYLESLNKAERAVAVAAGQLEAIAQAHAKLVDEHGGTDGCKECDLDWPCPTYVWATTPRRPWIDPWDPTDDEPAPATPADEEETL